MPYNVRFPGIGVEFQINPVALTVFGIEIRWYGILLAIGFLLAYVYAILQCKRFNINQSHLTDSVIVGFFTGIIGARLYYVLFYPGKEYFENPLSILNVNQGGIAIYGGIIGGILGGIFVARKKKLPIPALLDITAISFLIGQCIGRWGNFFNQEAFGVPTQNIFRMVSENTKGLEVHPCFLYESFWCFVCFIGLHVFNTKFKKFNGETFLLYVVLYGTERFLVESLRTDSLIIPFVGLRVSQFVSAIIVLVSVIIIIYIKCVNKKEVNSFENN